MNAMISSRIGWAIFTLLVWVNVSWSQQGQDSNGAFILVSKKGDVRYLNAADEEMPDVGVGLVIPGSYYILTGDNGNLVGLLSNGTLLTLTENTRMKVATFKQEPFRDDGSKLAELPGEPSSSEVLIDLDFGSLVVKTKKLNKSSSFDINSPLGVAGIRGTEFQMASTPGQGVQLDVTESTVAFTPPGGGEIKVSQGGGLSVSPTGVPTQRPVNPTVATKIVATNNAAVIATEEVSMSEVVAAVEKASVDREKPSQNANEKETKKSSDEADEPLSSEKEESEIKNKQKQDNEGETNSDESSLTPEPKDSKKQKRRTVIDDTKDQKQEGDGPKSKKSTNTPQGKDSTNQKQVPKTSDKKIDLNSGGRSQQAVQPDKSQLLENNPELKKNQRLAKYGLTREQNDRYDRLSANAREQILLEGPATLIRLLGLRGFEAEQANLFFGYDRETRDLLLRMSDDVLVTLLDPVVDGVLLKESLQKISRSLVRPGSLPEETPNPVVNDRAIELGGKLMNREDSEIMDELLVLADGSLDAEWLRVGEVAEILTQRLEIGDFQEIDRVSKEEFSSNPFLIEVANIYDQLELDALVNGADKVMGGDHLIVLENAKAFGSHFSNGVSEVLLVSRDLIEFKGDFTWSTPEVEGARLVVMSGGDLKVGEGATIRSVTSDLVLASRENLLLNQVILEGANEVAIRGMRDVDLNDVTLRARMLATVKAKRDLNVNGLSFNQDISRIVMEAQTMRLRNVNFPGMAQVRLNSLKGAIDGRYPNFGNVSAAQQIGRVNFIQNVRSGGNLLFDRPSFDLHGKNIQIGKIARP